MALSARQRSGASSSASGAQRHAIGARALGRAAVRPGLASLFSLASPHFSAPAEGITLPTKELT